LIVDYSSAVPVSSELQDAGIRDSRIKVIRIDGKVRWWLADAFNIALSKVLDGQVLKLDADHAIDPTLLDSHVLTNHDFFTGHWATRDPLQAHTNGAILAHAEHLHAVGGWDPRIRNYGWDDSDLYERLTYFGLKRNIFAEGQISHLAHSNKERLGHPDNPPFNPADMLRAFTEANRVVSEADLPWRRKDCTADLLQKTAAPSANITGSLTPTDRALISLETLGDQLSKSGSILNRIGKKLPIPLRNFILKSAPVKRNIEQRIRFSDKPRRTLIVRVEAGLGNRLRALASGFQYAHRTNSELQVAWIPDAHCEARFSDLFVWGGTVFETEGDLTSALESLRPKKFDWSVEMGVLSALTARLWRGPLYIRSSKLFLMDSSESLPIVKRFLRSLNPQEKIVQLIDRVPGDFAVGLHVRQAGGPSYEHLPYEALENWGAKAHRRIANERSKTKSSIFALILDHLGSNSVDGQPISVFVAVDNRQTKYELIQTLGDRARFIPSSPEGRGVNQIQEALAEMYLLARADLLVGSTYSSFSDVAHLLALDRQKFVQVGGRHFNL
jgi:hypothetical protein